MTEEDKGKGEDWGPNDQGPTRSLESRDVTSGATSTVPEQIGRYRVHRELGRGGFGIVYLAHDQQLQRAVAVKVPYAKLVSKPENAEAYLAEARALAALEHAHIVPVYDVGQSDEYPCYIVSKFVDGASLAEHMKQVRLGYLEAAEVCAAVAEALQHAHTHGLVHRDVKPGNILVDRGGSPFLVDFGLALREDGKVSTSLRYVGTPAYMSPEQARGEGHRVDGRSDIYSLGAVLYRLLTGRCTFSAPTNEELFALISTQEPKPPRQINERIPKELERICLKALSRRASDRYTTAKDMADDIRHFLLEYERTPSPAGSTAEAFEHGGANSRDPSRRTASLDRGRRPLQVVPKGLRAFDEHDADFFLGLLPGPRDRSGLPDSIRFWKTRIEEPDPDKTFSVGVIYGPSGCGKSSLLRAGLLPRLAENVTAVYIEASADRTEACLLSQLRKRCSGVIDGMGLIEALTALRRGEVLPTGEKVLLVLDQFEQWLLARRDDEDTELLQALRQCDGGNVQCIVLVRDDFWMAVTRFMRELEIPLIEAQNSAAVDLFGPRHARDVLAAFGRSFGALPDNTDESSKDCEAFLHQAISGLATEGKVICVRLALFAEMIKEKAWVPATLREVGGTEGIGVLFLEETLDAPSAPPEHRLHQKAARSVLGALLPESSSDIERHIHSYEELLHASGYVHRPKDFERLLEILDTELRLVTPTDAEVGNTPQEPTSPGSSQGRYFQVTHDYLVPSLREWLTRKQRETRRGRAELCLAERVSAWDLHRRSGDLPSWWEFMAIGLYTRRAQWSALQKTMMRKATGYYLTRILAVLLLVGVVGWGAWETYVRTKVEGLIGSLAAAETCDVPEILVGLEPYRRQAISWLRHPQPPPRRSSKAALHVDLARLHFGILAPADLKRLGKTLLVAPPEEARVIAEQLGPVAAEMSDSSWSVLAESAVHREILATATFLARHFPEDPHWEDCLAPVSESLMAANPVHASEWMENLAPIGQKLVGPLRTFLDKSVSGSSGAVSSQHLADQRHVAAAALARYLSDDPEEVSRLLVFYASDAYEFQSLIEPLHCDLAASAKYVREHLTHATLFPDTHVGSDGDTAGQDHELSCTTRETNAIVALTYLEDESQLLRSKLRCAEDRTLRSQLTRGMARLGVPVEDVVQMLLAESNADVRAALLLALGDYSRPTVHRKLEPLIERQIRLSLQSYDSGEHAAAAWLARRWEIQIRREQLVKLDPKRGDWYEGPDEHWLSIIRDRLDHDFSIGAREVTIEQYEQFNPDYRTSYTSGLEEFLVRSTPGDCPAVFVSIYDAMAYCNWLSLRGGIPSEQLCYEELADGTFRPKQGYLRMEGYRLPIQEEWTLACQADATTPFSFGNALELLPDYAWYYANARSDGQNRGQRVGQLKPNAWGMSDMYGNVWEWTTQFGAEHWSRLCGGSCDNDPCDLLVVGQINFKDPGSREHRIGFRIARTVTE